MLVLGLMSGTSVDGIDAALVEITDLESEIDFKDPDLGQSTDRPPLNAKPLRVELIAGQTYKYDLDLQTQILGVCGGKPLTMAEYCDLDDRIAIAFAQAAQSLQQSLDTSIVKQR